MKTSTAVEAGRRDFLITAGNGALVLLATQTPVGAALQRDTSYIDLLHECYRDELWGSRVFELFGECRPMAAREQGLLGVLAILEKTMQAHLERALRRHGQTWDGRAYRAEADTIAQGIAKRYGHLPWHRFNTEFETGIGPYLQKYSLLRDMAPAEDRPFMDIFVEHELALQTLARMEQLKESEASLSAVWRVLEKSQRLAYASKLTD